MIENNMFMQHFLYKFKFIINKNIF